MKNESVSAGQTLSTDEQHREACLESLLAKVRAMFAVAYSRRVLEGYTAAEMAERIGLTEKEFRYRMMAPRSLKLGQISDILWAMDFEPELTLIDRRS